VGAKLRLGGLGIALVTRSEERGLWADSLVFLITDDVRFYTSFMQLTVRRGLGIYCETVFFYHS
jgi:hypothetical protein